MSQPERPSPMSGGSAVLSTVVGTGSELGFGPTRWLAGFAFSLGLILVVVGCPTPWAARSSAPSFGSLGFTVAERTVGGHID